MDDENYIGNDGSERWEQFKKRAMDIRKRSMMWPVITPDENYFCKLRKLRQYYEIELPYMLEHHEDHPTRFYRAYPYDWSLHQTPIEQDAWQVIRSLGHIAMYPQFPVDKYHIDFAAPHLNIGLELDGRQWHNEDRDLIRDKALKKLGWKIYRITGSEMHKVIPSPFDREFDSRDEAADAIIDFINNSGEGVIYAIRAIHFDDSRGRFMFRPRVLSDRSDAETHEYWVAFIRQVCYNSLQDHTNYYSV